MNKFISGTDLLTAVFAILIIEAVIALIFDLMPGLMPGFSSLSIIGVTRSLQITALLLILFINCEGINTFGLSGQELTVGIQTGIIWSLLFGLTALTAGTVLYVAGVNPLDFIGAGFSKDNPLFFYYFLIACIVSPVAEELFFRGFLYSWLRQFKVLPAIIISSLIFALFHFSFNSLPVIQFTGALVFAASFEYSKSLAAPIIIHIAGNMALICLV